MKLSEEIRGILGEAKGEIQEGDDDSSEDGEHICEDGTPCWQLQEAAQFVADDISETTGLDPEVLATVLIEAIKCDSACREKFTTPKGDFKGSKGVAFANCEEYAKKCCTGVKDPAAFCAYIGKKARKG